MSSLIHQEYPEDTQQEEILLYKIKWLMIFRIVLVTLLLGSAIIIQLSIPKSRTLDFLYIFIILSYSFTALTMSWLKRVKNLVQYAYLQICFDMLFETGIVYITGGIESIFTFTYIATIISAGILLFRQGAFLAASISTILYGVLLDLQFYRLLPLYTSMQFPYTRVDASTVYYNIFLNACAFYLVAFLSSYLSESLKKTHQRLRQTSHDLNELQAFHHNILQSMQSGVLTTDLSGKITSYNRAAEIITGYALGEVYGKNLDEIFPDLDINILLGNFPDRAADFCRRVETEMLTRSGTRVYLGFSLSPFLDNQSKLSGLIGIFQDLTELRAMQEQIARTDRLVAIGQLAAGVAHEIRNPLASISGSIQLLRSELIANPENKALVEIILRESARLDRILSDFLSYARPRPLMFAKSDIVHEVIFSTITLLKRDERFEADTYAIQVDSDPNFPKIVCDVQQLQQVMWNLCLNALQAMPNGGMLRLETSLETLDEWELETAQKIEVGVIAVSDTGMGMDDETLRHIFHPFYTTKSSGTGLGLAIVHSIVKNHHGTIRVKSLPHQGARFEVVLPLKQEYW